MSAQTKPLPYENYDGFLTNQKYHKRIIQLPMTNFCDLLTTMTSVDDTGEFNNKLQNFFIQELKTGQLTTDQLNALKNYFKETIKSSINNQKRQFNLMEASDDTISYICQFLSVYDITRLEITCHQMLQVARINTYHFESTPYTSCALRKYRFRNLKSIHFHNGYSSEIFPCWRSSWNNLDYLTIGSTHLQYIKNPISVSTLKFNAVQRDNHFAAAAFQKSIDTNSVKHLIINKHCSESRLFLWHSLFGGKSWNNLISLETSCTRLVLQRHTSCANNPSYVLFFTHFRNNFFCFFFFVF